MAASSLSWNSGFLGTLTFLRKKLGSFRQSRPKPTVHLHRLTHRGEPDYRFRRVEIGDPEEGRLVFLSPHLRLASTAIADIYRGPWRIESFFKALKQNLKIETFAGVTHNLLKTRVWTAMRQNTLFLLLLFAASQIRYLHHQRPDVDNTCIRTVGPDI